MFKKALPIWLKSLSLEKNIQARFVAEFIARKNMLLKLSGATFYKVKLNGELIHHGPAPCATGYARVDEIKLCAAENERCVLDIEVAGYNVDSYAAVNQESFVIAEVVAGEDVLCATGYDFSAYRVASRIREVIRYSFQRQYSEAWDLSIPDEPYEWEKLELNIQYIKRSAPLPSLDVEAANGVYCKGKFTYSYKTDEELANEGKGYVNQFLDLSGFPPEDVIHRPMTDFVSMDYRICESREELPLQLRKGEFAVFKCEKNSAALMSLNYFAQAGTKVILAFDENVENDKFSLRLKSANAIEISSSGETDFTNFEIYGFMYFGVFVVEGEINLHSASRTLVRNSPASLPMLHTDDKELLAIYEAALESFRCNSLAIFTDCPSRERAGWLCDSYFISRVAYTLMGNTKIEDDFLENYRNHGCKTLPKGMVPMCYPAEHPNGRFIPQWSMWLVLELPEYKARCPYADMELFRDMTYGLVRFFEGYENELSLLEDLPSWNFVEWSRANEWCAGVNFPTNMLYSEFLSTVSSLYGDASYKEKAEKIRKTVRELSYDGEFFHDQACRDADGALKVNSNISEACQYYAFYFGVANEQDYASLKETLVSKFGPDSENYPDIEKANALMGIYLRIDLLVKWGMKDMCLDEIRGYFLRMAKLTGTLWEHKNVASSLNHGFPSYIADVLLKLLNK